MKLKDLLLGFACIALTSVAIAQDFDIKQGDTIVSASSFGKGDHVLIALPGAIRGSNPDKNSLRGRASEIANENAGIRVISISWSGPGDVAAAVRFAKESGAKKISLLGHSRGAGLAAQFASSQPDGEFDTIILLSSGDDQGIPLTKSKKLFVYSKGDSLARWTPRSFEKSAEPKELIALNGSGHGSGDLKAARPSLIADIVAVLKR